MWVTQPPMKTLIFFHRVTMLKSDYAHFSRRGCYENKIFVDSILHDRFTFRLRQDASRSKRLIWQAGFYHRQ